MTERGDIAPVWSGRGRTLLRGGSVYSPADPFATSMLVADGVVAWIGSEGAALAMSDGVDEVVDLDGALVTPAFVDSHVHLTSSGIAISGLDLTGTTSAADALQRLDTFCRQWPEHLVLGHGWDESRWETPEPLTAARIDDVAGNRQVYLTRIDVHSAVASSAFLSAHPQLSDHAGFSRDGRLTSQSHYVARSVILDALTAEQRSRAQRAARQQAASRGIGLIVEIAGPEISTESDLTAALALNDAAGPRLVGYWGELGAAEKARDLGALGAAGDLYADGALGSRTAALRHSYEALSAGTARVADESPMPDPPTGRLDLGADQVARHVVECHSLGLQSGFHAIGDAALDQVISGYRMAASRLGVAALAAGSHRIEHVEMAHPEHLDAMAELGLIASVQPVFDELWGGPSQMYAERLGERRAVSMNPWASMAAKGIPMAFGSDSPVTGLDPWRAVRAAVNHHTEEQRISARAAFAAHTRGGWRAVGNAHLGVLVPGAPADYAVWEPSALTVQAPDDRIQAWSTDPRSGTPGLPDMSAGLPSPRCLRTVVAGTTVYQSR